MLSFDVFSVGPQQPVERAVELTMTWDTMTLMWRHCNVINSYHIVMFVLLQRTVDIIVTSYIFLPEGIRTVEIGLRLVTRIQVKLGKWGIWVAKCQCHITLDPVWGAISNHKVYRRVTLFTSGIRECSSYENVHPPKWRSFRKHFINTCQKNISIIQFD